MFLNKNKNISSVNQQALSAKRTNKKVTFTDLSIECVQQILDIMSVVDLFSMSNTTNTLYSLAEKTLKRRLPGKKVILQYPYHTFNAKSFEQYEWETDKIILMHHMPKHIDISWYLKQFGHLIQSIEITHGPTSPKKTTKRLVYIVNSHCGKTLQHLQITNQNEEIFTGLRQPFASVDILELNGVFENFGQFHLIFPSATRLTMTALTISRIRNLEFKMPKLEFLSVADKDEEISEEMRSVLLNHQHIRDLNIEGPSLNLLKFISSSMPSLEGLSIDRIEFDDEDEEIKFDRLKRFALMGYIETMPINIILGDIEEFEVYNVGDTESLVNTTLEHKANLTKLVLMIKLSNEEIFELSKADLKVTELKIVIGRGTNINYVTKLINYCRRLTTVDIYVEPEKLRISAYKALNARLARKFMIFLKDTHVSLVKLDDIVTYPLETVLDE